ncbi:hypothetical protein TIFTF001_017972 [Ficus carica]|uniref:Uncharacterized protein n=1 Tax=Ficus carica TaxID=3494 RepID=A0AA88DB91_FICCA|nr:hypothetical protein TIFTF001_017972 [Ficus carica]
MREVDLVEDEDDDDDDDWEEKRKRRMDKVEEDVLDEKERGRGGKLRRNEKT